MTKKNILVNEKIGGGVCIGVSCVCVYIEGDICRDFCSDESVN